MSEIIYCSHDGKNGIPTEAFPIGDDGKVIALCPLCLSSITGAILSSLLKDSVKEYLRESDGYQKFKDVTGPLDEYEKLVPVEQE